MAIKLIDRIRGAIHGFKEPSFIRGTGVVIDGETFTWASPSVAYLCDGKACPGKQCNMCAHTFDLSHAINFVDVSLDCSGMWMELPLEDRVVT